MNINQILSDEVQTPADTDGNVTQVAAHLYFACVACGGAAHTNVPLTNSLAL